MSLGLHPSQTQQRRSKGNKTSMLYQQQQPSSPGLFPELSPSPKKNGIHATEENVTSTAITANTKLTGKTFNAIELLQAKQALGAAGAVSTRPEPGELGEWYFGKVFFKLNLPIFFLSLSTLFFLRPIWFHLPSLSRTINNAISSVNAFSLTSTFPHLFLSQFLFSMIVSTIFILLTCNRSLFVEKKKNAHTHAQEARLGTPPLCPNMQSTRWKPHLRRREWDALATPTPRAISPFKGVTKRMVMPAEERAIRLVAATAAV